jgi:hypothetical protein
MSPEKTRLLVRLYDLGQELERLSEMATKDDLEQLTEGRLTQLADGLHTLTLLLSEDDATVLRTGARDIFAMASSKWPPSWHALEHATARAVEALRLVAGHVVAGRLADLSTGLLILCNADITRDGPKGFYPLPDYAAWLGCTAADLDDVVRAVRHSHLFKIGDQDGPITVMTLSGDGRLDAESLLEDAAESRPVRENLGAGGTMASVASAIIPRVFISYSHDNEPHKTWVRELAEGLVRSGVEVVLDQWDLRLGQDLAHFMERSMTDSHRVVMVCSSVYVQKANSGLGGVGYEKMIATREIYERTTTTRFIPLVRGNPAKSLPTFLGVRRYVDFNDDAAFQAGLEELLRELHDAPKAIRPALGTNPFAGSPPASTARPIELAVSHAMKPNSTGEIHWYDLVVAVRNVSARRLDDWQVEIDFPTPLLDQVVQAMRVPSRSDERRTTFLMDGRATSLSLYPNQEQSLRIGYFVNNDVFWNRPALLGQSVRARAYVSGEVVAEVIRAVRDFQNF